VKLRYVSDRKDVWQMMALRVRDGGLDDWRYQVPRAGLLDPLFAATNLEDEDPAGLGLIASQFFVQTWGINRADYGCSL
jgi:hypothetical protein